VEGVLKSYDAYWALSFGCAMLAVAAVGSLCRRTLFRLHKHVQLGSELLFLFFGIQNIIITRNRYWHYHTPPSIDAILRTSMIMVLLPMAMAILVSTRFTLLICVVGNLAVVVTSPYADIAAIITLTLINTWMLILIHFTLRRERESFVQKLRLLYHQREDREIAEAELKETKKQVVEAVDVQEQNKKLNEENQRAYSKIVAATAHDLRTATSVVQGGCRLLQRKLWNQRQSENEDQFFAAKDGVDSIVDSI